MCLASLTWKREGRRRLSLLPWKVSLPAQPAGRRVARRPDAGLGDFVRCYISSAALFKGIFICLGWFLGADLPLSSDCVRSTKLSRKGGETSTESQNMKVI